MTKDVAASWDAEYAQGRYHGEPPVEFVTDIITAATAHRLRRGVDIGCGNGRNLLPMLDAGLDLIGLDISTEAINQLRRRRPDLAHRFIVGDLTALPPSARYDMVIGIQVFQHGTRAASHQHLGAAADRVAVGGLLCVRVNATATDIEYDHDVLDGDAASGFTIRYRSGPKTGLSMHFYAAAELQDVVGDDFTAVSRLRLRSTQRRPPRQGQWSQWEAIWQRLR
jgi:SAM-dependent methyltransferase